MAAQVKSFHLNSHSKKSSLPTSKMQNMSSARGEELMKGVFRKRAIDKGNNEIESNHVNDSKKKSNVSGHHNQQNQGGNELLNVLRKGTEKLSIKENICKSGPHSKVCYCAPTTHEGSFRCRLHRKKSATDDNNNNKSNVRLNSQYGIVEFQPQMPRFGRVSCAQVGTRDSLIKLSRMDSV